jgi:hypothetical protein
MYSINYKKKYDSVMRQLKSYVLHNQKREIVRFATEALLG